MEVCLFRAGCELATWQKILDSGMILQRISFKAVKAVNLQFRCSKRGGNLRDYRLYFRLGSVLFMGVGNEFFNYLNLHLLIESKSLDRSELMYFRNKIFYH